MTGTGYAELTHHANDFARDAEEHKEENYRRFREVFPKWPEDRIQLHPGTGPPHHATAALLRASFAFVPDTYLDTRTTEILTDPTLLDRCQVTEQPRGVMDPTSVGVDLDKVGMRLSVWIPQYRQELERQLEALPTIFSETKQRVERLLEPIRVLDAAGVKTTVVSFIPKVSSTTSDPSLYEYLVDTLDAPLQTKFNANLKGVGRDPGISFATNLRHTGLWLSIPTGKFLVQDSFLDVGTKILDHVKVCKKKLLNL